jgi:hypothetical protein
MSDVKRWNCDCQDLDPYPQDAILRSFLRWNCDCQELDPYPYDTEARQVGVVRASDYDALIARHRALRSALQSIVAYSDDGACVEHKIARNALKVDGDEQP